jgi:hypothetical protein
VTRSAIFDEARTYRYVLSIPTGNIFSELNTINWLLCNPSTADEVKNDPTVERVFCRAAAWGYLRVVITNIFAYRSTDPMNLRYAKDPVGPDNDRHIIEQASEADLVVCGWGEHGSYLGRGNDVLDMLRRAGIVPHALKINKGGQCGHPLYVAYKCEPFQMEIEK